MKDSFESYFNSSGLKHPRATFSPSHKIHPRDRALLLVCKFGIRVKKKSTILENLKPFVSHSCVFSFLLRQSMARDLFHEAVKHALEKSGWVIIADPLELRFGLEVKYLIDLAAERLIVAERGLERIAVEIKSFTESSKSHEFHAVLGQYLNYRVALRIKFPDYKLYLAVPLEVFEDFMQREIVQLILREYSVNVLSYNPVTEEITHEQNY